MREINSEIISETILRAKRSERRRMNYNFHELDEPLQRLINAIEPDSYIQPHRHTEPGKAEVFLVLKGRGAVFEFNQKGEVVEKAILEEKGHVRGVIIDPGVWHTILALDEGTVFFEVKIGPYHPTTDKNFAPWAPIPKDTEAAQDYLRTLKDSISFPMNS